ncbi:hypothetical protein MNBD_GAMMA21-2347 [hydrothermal vent metagenome]|uniref:YtkA-like domain-containing protein n=1 Tax=hydrothermal vent metagenome TaxID=652676 RepID=A0A3B1AK77_9ZZZZ
MNLLISIPVGIAIIIIGYALALRMSNINRYVLAGVFAIMVVAIYSFISAVSWPGADVYAMHLAIYLVTLYAITIISSQKSQSKKMHWGPKAIFVFFAVVLIVNSFFVYFAQTGMSTDFAKWVLPEPRSKASVQSVFPGVVSHNFREKGNQFNAYQLERSGQESLGWKVKLGWQDAALINNSNTFKLKITQRDGVPLKNARVTAKFLYPANLKYDQTHVLTEDKNGLYFVTMQLQQPGNWDVIVSIQHDDDNYEVRSKTTVKSN